VKSSTVRTVKTLPFYLSVSDSYNTDVHAAENETGQSKVCILCG